MPVKPVLLLIATFALGALSLFAAPPDQYTSWLDKDVHWIITEAESAAFKQLDKDEYRDRFISQFWDRRDPIPETPENEYKEEHYRRIAYSNAQFASKIDGSLTDRGAVYIRYGPPDRIDHPRFRPAKSMIWFFRQFGNSGQEKSLEFVDTCDCGEYRLVTERSLIETPPPDPTLRQLLKQSEDLGSAEGSSPPPFRQ
jgi:GWxTD domain-containing protein